MAAAMRVATFRVARPTCGSALLAARSCSQVDTVWALLLCSLAQAQAQAQARARDSAVSFSAGMARITPVRGAMPALNSLHAQ